MYGIYKIGEFLEKVLITIFTYNRILSSPTASINLSEILYNLDKDKSSIKKYYLKRRIKYALSKLEKKGFIKIYKNKKNRFQFKFTEKVLNLIKIKKIIENSKELKKIKKGKRILFFDIPEHLKKERNEFRNFIKLLGYKEFQKSVFISEFDNYDDLIAIVEFLNLKPYIKTGIFYED